MQYCIVSHSVFERSRGDKKAMKHSSFSFSRMAIGLPLSVILFLSAATPLLGQTDQIDLNQPAIPVKSPSHVFLNGVALAGSRLVAVGEHSVIIYSSDQGASWQQASVPTDVLLNAVSFADAQNGWAVGHFGVVLHTADGGKTWQKQLDGNQVNRLALAAAQAATAQNSNLITVPLALHRASLFLDTGPDKPFLAVDALSPSNAVVVGAYRMADRTMDGGKTWQDMSLNIEDRFSHNLYSIATIGQDIFIAAETGPVFRSTDGGASFAAVTAPSSTTLFGVLGTKEGGVLVYGVAGAVFLSHDQGKDWLNVAVSSATNLLAGLLLKSGAVLLASESGLLYISRDNGQTFKPLPVNVPMAITDLVEMPNGNVAVTGSGGVVILPADDFAQAN